MIWLLEAPRGALQHAKLMLIDGSWATVGSANTDYRSFFVNLELNLFTTNVLHLRATSLQ